MLLSRFGLGTCLIDFLNGHVCFYQGFDFARVLFVCKKWFDALTWHVWFCMQEVF